MKRNIILLGFISILHGLLAQNTINTQTIDSVANQITKSIIQLRQEKVYLHLDRTDYIAGDKIWFNAYLTDAVLHEEGKLSRFVYVELINPLDSIIFRLKVRPNEGSYHGQILLPEYMPEGNYKIRAYTQYMRNAGEDFFFSKYIHIGHPQSADFKVEAQFSSAGGQKVNAEIRVTDIKTNSLIAPMANTKLNQLAKKQLKPDEDNIFRFSFNLPKNKQNNVLCFDFTYNNKNYDKYIQVSIPNEQFDVSFFPTGGYLVAGNRSGIAFKSISSNGLHTNIRGEIYDNQDHLISEFESQHWGMGYLDFIPEAGKSYHAICKNDNNISIRVDLPQPATNVSVLNITEKNKSLVISLNSNKTSIEDYYLLIHVRGMMQYSKKWDPSKNMILCDMSSIPAGVVHLILLNSKYEPISEQLVFNSNLDNEKVNVQYQTNKSNYAQRELIKNQFKLLDIDNLPLESHCSISITDSKDVIPDSTTNMLAYYLLSSDLKGYIENPAYYFKKDYRNSKQLNLLMMTQGWRRYKITDFIHNDSTQTHYRREYSQKISGTVKEGLLSKPVKNGNISIVSLANNFYQTLKTDDQGQFSMDNIEFQDSLRFHIQARNKKGNDRVQIFVDKEEYPEHHASWIIPDEKKSNNSDQFNQFITKADLKYTYDNGMRIINLDEVVIKGNIREKKKQDFNSPYADGDVFMTEEELNKYSFMDIYDALKSLPGVEVYGKDIKIRSAFSLLSKTDPLILVDDMPLGKVDDIEMVNILDVAQIDVYKTAKSAIFGARGSSGVISIHTKRGTAGTLIEKDNYACILPLGYQLPEEFYSPKYDTREAFNSTKPDLRTTIYWNPNIQVDKNGMASFEFYAADAATTYDVVLEGIGKFGHIIQYRGTISRNAK